MCVCERDRWGGRDCVCVREREGGGRDSKCVRETEGGGRDCVY